MDTSSILKRLDELEAWKKETLEALAELERWFCLDCGPTMETYEVRDERSGEVVMSGMKCRVCGGADLQIGSEFGPIDV